MDTLRAVLVTSFTRNRRHRAVALMLVGLVVFAMILGLSTYALLGTERIRQYTVDVVVAEDGSARVREVIDYDFGSNDKHGIFRDFPGHSLEGDVSVSDIRVTSATAADEFDVTDNPVEIRIGSPYSTVSGLHRYVVEYRLTGAVTGSGFGFDVIGTGWSVPIDSADITLATPYDVDGVNCFLGSDEYNQKRCDFGVSPGTIAVSASDLRAGAGITINGRQAGTSSRPVAALPGDVDLDVAVPWQRTLWLVVGLGVAAYLAGLVPGVWWTRRMGRDKAWAGGGIDAVFGGPGLESAPIADLTAERQVTIQFEPPRDLTPAQGGVLLDEKVTENHRVAWLAQQALDGWVAIEKGGKRLRWTAPDDKWASAPTPLRKMFGRRRKITLGVYDARFAKGYKLVDKELADWKQDCELWDHATERRLRRISRTTQIATAVGVLAGLLGTLGTVSATPVVAMIIAAVSGLCGGVAVALAANDKELSIRTPEGFALRQLVEGFRRFFVASEGRHAREAAERDELRLYSAWAVALGEVTRWNAALEAAALPEETPGLGEANNFVHMYTVTHMTTVAPPPQPSTTSGGSGYTPSFSSGGGYSGGSSVGSGGGGGGGGSW